MASNGDEDVDLDVLRSQVLASFKPKRKANIPVNGIKNDEEDLAALRSAALHSKKASELPLMPRVPAFASKIYSRTSRRSKLGIHAHNSHRRIQSSNLIQIKPVPLEVDGSDTGSNFSFHPRLSENLRKDAEPSASKTKTKSNSKFSRFESDSSSDDSDDDYFGSLLNSEENTEMSWSLTDDRTSDSHVQVAEAESQETPADASLNSDKENDKTHPVASDSETSTSVASEHHSPEADDSAKVLREERSSSSCSESSSTKDDVQSEQSNTNRDNDTDNESVRQTTTDSIASKTVTTTTQVPSTDADDNSKQPHTFIRLKHSSDENHQDRLEARKRKFETPGITKPVNSKICFRNMVNDSSDNPVVSSTRDKRRSTRRARTSSSSPSVRERCERSGNETSSSSERNSQPIPSVIKCAEKSVTEPSLNHSDQEVDLRDCLRYRRHKQLRESSWESSSSSSNGSSSSSGHNKARTLKSVLSVVKSEREAESSSKAKKKHRRRRSHSRSDRDRKRRKHEENGKEEKPVAKDAVVKGARVNGNHTTHRDTTPKVRKPEASPKKLPVRMRLGVPVHRSGSDVNGNTKTASRLPGDRNRRRRDKSRSGSQTATTKQVKVKVNDSIVNKKSSLSTTAGERNTGKSEYANPSDLDAKIRRIQEKNAIIRQRAEEIKADRKMYN